LQPARRPGHGPENVLRQVGGVRVLQAALAGEVVDDRTVNLHELRPRLAVAGVAEADQQARTRRRQIAHGGSPSLHTEAGGKPIPDFPRPNRRDKSKPARSLSVWRVFALSLL